MPHLSLRCSWPVPIAALRTARDPRGCVTRPRRASRDLRDLRSQRWFLVSGLIDIDRCTKKNTKIWVCFAIRPDCSASIQGTTTKIPWLILVYQFICFFLAKITIWSIQPIFRHTHLAPTEARTSWQHPPKMPRGGNIVAQQAGVAVRCAEQPHPTREENWCHIDLNLQCFY